MAKEFKNYIDGKWQRSASGKTFENINPANCTEVVGRFQQSNRKDVNSAVAAAAAAAAAAAGATVAAPMGEATRVTGRCLRSDPASRVPVRRPALPSPDVRLWAPFRSEGAPQGVQHRNATSASRQRERTLR